MGKESRQTEPITLIVVAPHRIHYFCQHFRVGIWMARASLQDQRIY
ncbi:hypothetical protein LINPERPRIM_LOCUS3035 [Linum perenne]